MTRLQPPTKNTLRIPFPSYLFKPSMILSSVPCKDVLRDVCVVLVYVGMVQVMFLGESGGLGDYLGTGCVDRVIV